MTDLGKQLHGYGRQIETDIAKGASEGSAPAQVIRFDAARIRASQFGASPWSKSRTRSGSGRSAWVAVAAATAAVAVTASLLLASTSPEEGSMDNKTSGVVVGLCLFTAGCTSGAQGAGTTATVAGQPASSVSAAVSTSPTGTSVPGLFAEPGAVTPGTYQLDLVGTPLQLTVPAGWSRFEDFALEGPDSSYFAFFDVENTYKDAATGTRERRGSGRPSTISLRVSRRRRA